MKKRNIIIILLAVVCVGMAVAVFMFSKYYVPKTTTSATQESTVQEEPVTQAPVADITLALSEYRVFLNWKEVQGADGYVVYYDNGSGWKELGKADINSFRTKGLKGGTSYTFGIKSYRKQGEKDVLNEDMNYTIKGNTLPDTPQMTAKKEGNTVSLKWDAVKNANEYMVYSMVEGDKEWTKRTVTKDTSYSFEAEKVPKQFVAVRAVRLADSQKFVSDYVKTLITDQQPEGKLYSCGDSIATGVGSHSYSYANLFAEENNLELINKATTGSQLSSEDPKKDHICQNIIKDVTADYDYLFIEGGNNDYYFGSKLGEVTKDGTTEFDMNTTCGALESALSHLKENCPDTKIVFIIIHNAGGRATTKNDLGLTFTDYAEGIRAVCKKYGVAVADCLKDSGFDTSDVKVSEEYTHKFNGVFPTGDGVHPTEEAYKKFYMPLIEKAVK